MSPSPPIPPAPILAQPPATAPVGRLAPSPTGLLHLGHARSFLIAWWHARSRGGRVLLRLEDLDGPRVKPGMSDASVADLEWLGLDWDGQPFVQSMGRERFASAVGQLVAAGRAYPCVCTRGALRAALSAPQQGDIEPRYPGTCRDRYASLDTAAAATGRDPGLRFRVPEGTIELVDGVVGPFRHDVATEVGDFLVSRRDGTPAYQLAVVVDDAAQGVTEVVRGDDLLPSTPRQWLLQQALGLPSPAWFHLPLVLDATGRRLAKRADDLALATLRAGGTDPRAIVTWAAHGAGIPGLTPQDRTTAAECAARFAMAVLPRVPVVLDPATITRLRGAR
ncbi:MAG: tRNA glutamyl-Q(34) synthetase GluQRS [Polyangiaceae bacterium]|nr:tRNA glutamyl-Q(34) synthetase GluQRS [Polyangiaceae bacterium]